MHLEDGASLSRHVIEKSCRQLLFAPYYRKLSSRGFGGPYSFICACGCSVGRQEILLSALYQHSHREKVDSRISSSAKWDGP